MDLSKSHADDHAPSTPPKRKYYIERNPGNVSDLGAGGLNKLSDEERAVQVKRSMQILISWPKWEVWPFKATVPVLAIAAAIPGFVLNSAFRKALLLGHYGKNSSYLVTMALPSAISAISHNLLITTDILEQNTKCPVCLQVRSAAVQFAAGFIYPSILVPVTNFPIASGIKDMYFPKINKQPREVLNFALDVFKSVKERYLALGVLQIVVAMGMTYFQQQCYYDTLLPILTGKQEFSKESRKVEFFKE